MPPRDTNALSMEEVLAILEDVKNRFFNDHEAREKPEFHF